MIFSIICVVLLFGLQQAIAQEFSMEGSWTAYSPTQLPAYSLRDHNNPGGMPDLSQGQISFNADGTVQNDFLPYTTWEVNDGFLVLSVEDTQGFYAVRELTPDVYVLVSLTVTEQNRSIISIRVHRPESLLLIRD